MLEKGFSNFTFSNSDGVNQTFVGEYLQLHVCECLCVCSCAGAGGDVCRAGGGGKQHLDGSHPGHVDEEVLPQPQTAGELR